MVHDSAASIAYLNDDLLKISRWAYQWKMIFNPDASKQAQEQAFIAKQTQVTTQLFILTMYQ